jgi:dienelactone hydrolase
MLRTLCTVAAFSLSTPAWAKLVTQAIDYKDGDQQLSGYLAYDDAGKGKRPGVLVFHEWKGLGDYVKGRAEQLASLGYVAFAADMYGKGVYAKSHEEAGKLAGAVRADPAMMRRRAMAALDVLKAQKAVDSERIAAIGYCFGGGAALEMARANAPLRGVVSFHGSLSTQHPEETKEVKPKVLVCQGGDDQHTLKDLPTFEDEMRRASADWRVNTYGGAVHSFTVKEAGNDPRTGMAYNAEADARSWRDMLAFFDELFKKP